MSNGEKKSITFIFFALMSNWILMQVDFFVTLRFRTKEQMITDIALYFSSWSTFCAFSYMHPSLAFCSFISFAFHFRTRFHNHTLVCECTMKKDVKGQNIRCLHFTLTWITWWLVKWYSNLVITENIYWTLLSIHIFLALIVFQKYSWIRNILIETRSNLQMFELEQCEWFNLNFVFK